MSSNSGKVPADRSVDGSSGADAAAEVSHIILQIIYFLFLVTFLLTSPPLVVFFSR